MTDFREGRLHLIGPAVVTDNARIAELTKVLRVISDEKRLHILGLLVRQEMCVCDIMQALGLSQSLVSHHLGVLRRIGLVRDRPDAQWVYYSVDPDKLAELNANFLWLLDIARLRPEAAYGASPRKCE